MTESKNSGEHQQARQSLPSQLREEFDALVEDYRFAAHVRYGKRFVSYAVLSDLIRAGWRRTESPIEEAHSSANRED